MSGPKGTSYEVVSPAELARREAEGLRSQLTQRRAQLAVLQAEAGADVVAATGAAPAIDLDGDLEQLRATSARLSAYETRLRDAVQDRRVAVAMREMAADANALDLHLDLPVPGSRRHSDASTASDAVARSDAASDAALEGRLARALAAAAGLPDREQSEVRAALASVAEARRAGDSARAALLVTHVETVVDRLTRANRAVEAVRADVRALQDELALVSDQAAASDDLSQAVARVAADLAAATTGSQVDGARRAIAALKERCRVAQDRRFVLQQSIEVLQELGYSVEAGEPVEGVQPFVVTSGRWPRHALQLVMRPDQAAFNTAPMALTDTDARDDVAFERATCDDLERLRAGLRRRGVVAELSHEVPAGQLPVRRASDAARRAATRAQKAREVGR
ncbi:MAG: hypothetical protein ACTHN8_16235 [Angustibacter sp.]